MQILSVITKVMKPFKHGSALYKTKVLEDMQEDKAQCKLPGVHSDLELGEETSCDLRDCCTGWALTILHHKELSNMSEFVVCNEHRVRFPTPTITKSQSRKYLMSTLGGTGRRTTETAGRTGLWGVKTHRNNVTEQRKFIVCTKHVRRYFGIHVCRRMS
jgi:hypothetical protein